MMNLVSVSFFSWTEMTGMEGSPSLSAVRRVA